MSITEQYISETLDLKKSVSLLNHPRKEKLIAILDQELYLLQTTVKEAEESLNQKTWKSIQQGFKPYAEGNVNSLERTKSSLLRPLMNQFWDNYFSDEDNQKMRDEREQVKERNKRVKATLIRKYGFDPRER